MKVGMTRTFTVERVTRIELAWPAWKPATLHCENIEDAASSWFWIPE